MDTMGRTPFASARGQAQVRPYEAVAAAARKGRTAVRPYGDALPNAMGSLPTNPDLVTPQPRR